MFVEYTPGSGGKKVVVSRSRRPQRAKARLFSDSDDDDFTDSPSAGHTSGRPRPRRASRASQKSQRSKERGKQLTLTEMLGKSKNMASSSAAKSKIAASSSAAASESETDDETFSLDEPRDRSHFSSDASYRRYQEQLDAKMARQLQAEYEFEAKYKLNCVRRKGSENSYSFRRKSSRIKSKP